MGETTSFKLHDIVETVKGAKFWGRIISLDVDAERPGCTVLAIDPGFAGTKHVYPLAQLAPSSRETLPDGVEALRARLVDTIRERDVALAHDCRSMSAMGVGEGSGDLFIYGHGDAIRAARQIVDDLARTTGELRRERRANEEATLRLDDGRRALEARVVLLEQALRWCRPRLSKDVYREQLDRKVSLPPAEPRDEPAVVASADHRVEADAVAWQRLHPTKGTWVDVRQDDLEHYRREGQEIRALGVLSSATPPAPAVKEQDFLHRLRAANIARNAEYRAKTQGEELPLLFRTTEFAGEVGELLNVVKKIERERLGWSGKRASRDDLVGEFGGVGATFDLLAMALNVDIGHAIASEFNAVSDRLGLSTKLLPPSTEAQAGSASTPAEALPSQTSGGVVAWRCKDAGGKWMYGPDRDGGFWPDWPYEKLALAKPASEPAGGGVLLDGGWRTKHDDLLRANGILQMQLRECQDARRSALSSPASSPPAEAEALPAGVDAVREAELLREFYRQTKQADAARKALSEIMHTTSDEAVLKLARAGLVAVKQAASLSSAPAQAGSSPATVTITTNGTRRVIPAGEPVFLIRGQDIVAGETVRAWADAAERVGASPDAVRSAREHAAKMEAWWPKKVADLPEQEV